MLKRMKQTINKITKQLAFQELFENPSISVEAVKRIRSLDEQNIVEQKSKKKRSSQLLMNSENLVNAFANDSLKRIY